ncbi:hypothetical protein J6O48_02665 [bacterium]|nr:hypothetical protein [bacterium]
MDCLQYTEQHILDSLKLLHNNTGYDYRKDCIIRLYNYIYNNLPENYTEVFQSKFDKIYLKYFCNREFNLTYNQLYDIHLDIINQLFNYILYQQYDIKNIFNIETEENIITFNFYQQPYNKHTNIYDLVYSENLTTIKNDNIINIEKLTGVDLCKLNINTFKSYKQQYEIFNKNLLTLKNNIYINLQHLKKHYKINFFEIL